MGMEDDWVLQGIPRTTLDIKQRMEPAANKFHLCGDQFQAEAPVDAPVAPDRRLPQPTQMSPLLFLSAALFAQSFNEYVRNRADRNGRFPRGTLLIILANTVVFLKPGGVSSAAVCLAPSRIIERREFSRLVKSPFVHLDLPHLTSNMRSTLESGTRMEGLVGSQALLLDVAGVTLVSQGLHVAGAWAENRYLGTSAAYHSSGSVGFSSTCFALQVLVGYLEDEGNLDTAPRLVSAKFLCWANLAMCQILFPASNLQAHLCGILAGLVRVFVPGPFLLLRRSVGGLFRRIFGCGDRYTEHDVTQMVTRRKPSDLWVHLSFGTLTVLVHLLKIGQKRVQ